MITMSIVIFCGTIYCLGWLAIIILHALFQPIVCLFRRLFNSGDDVPEIIDDNVAEVETTKDDTWGRL